MEDKKKHIDQGTVRQIGDAANIVDVVATFVDLKKRGTEWVGLCPFHDDRHIGSFSVSQRKNICTCFSCGITYDPISFLMNYGSGMTYREALLWLANRYGIPVDGETAGEVKTVTPVVRMMKELPTLEMPGKWVADRLWSRTLVLGGTRRAVANPLLEWMEKLPWPKGGREKLAYWLTRYGVGTSSAPKTYGWTVWWSIDENRKVRQGKVMKYLPDGHRDKKSRYNFDTIGSITRRTGMWNDRQWEVRPCLFGLHLMNEYPDAEVCLVESEKTAVLAQCFSVEGEKIFMATGGKGKLSEKMLDPLTKANRHIILYPDVDGLGDWKEQEERIGYPRMRVSERVARMYDPEKDSGKSDIADILIRAMGEGVRAGQRNRLADIIEEYPAVGILIEGIV